MYSSKMSNNLSEIDRIHKCYDKKILRYLSGVPKQLLKEVCQEEDFTSEAWEDVLNHPPPQSPITKEMFAPLDVTFKTEEERATYMKEMDEELQTLFDEL